MESARKPSRQIDRALFDTAADIHDPEARREFLTQACAGNAFRLARIVGWLDARDAAEKFFRTATIARVEAGGDVVAALGGELATSGSVETGAAPSEYGPGSRIGRYRLLERIGEGGCGVVYLAEQHEPVRRKVALKVIRLGLDTREFVGRFEAERQAL